MNLTLAICRVVLLVLVLRWFLLRVKYAVGYRLSFGEWPKEKSWVWWVNAVTLSLLLSACADTIKPVAYQPVEVMVTRPCMQGKNPPPVAQTRIAIECDGKNCTLSCSDTRPEECAKHMAADIAELQREARESRRLIQECSK